MCRLLGIKNFDSTAHKEILQDFFSLAERGRVPPGNPPGHMDGWGIGWYADGKAKIEKSGGSALDEEKKISAIVSAIGNSKILIAHLRKSAWNDTSTSRHAHPFGYNNVIFAHNGTVVDYRPLQRSIPEGFAPEKDSLDSEVLLRAIISSQENTLGSQFTETIKKVKTLNYTALNILMSDGTSLFGYRDYTKYPDYYTLYSAQAGNASIICSEDLPAVGKWSALNNGQLIVL